MACDDFESQSFYISVLNKEFIKVRVKAGKKAGKKRFNASAWLDDVLDHLRAKGEPKPKTDVVVTDYPPTLNIDAWLAWVDYRKKVKLKKYKTNATMNELSTMGDNETQMLIVEQSIKKEYAGLFPVKGSKAQEGITDLKKQLNDTSWADNLNDVV